MKLVSAKFLISDSMGGAKSFGMPQIAVVGRSNVGKSSFLNMLANNGKLAKTSSIPGRTRLINYFEITLEGEDGKRLPFVFTDLPGYGFAKASIAEQNKWKGMIENYFDNAMDLRCVVLLLDIRHLPSVQDHIMFDYLFRKNINVTIIATKTDKLGKNQIAKSVKEIAASLKVGKDNIIVTSAETRQGKLEVLYRLWQFIQPVEEVAQEDEADE